MTNSEHFTQQEHSVALWLCGIAEDAVAVYASAGDHSAATVAVLRAALELAEKPCFCVEREPA